MPIEVTMAKLSPTMESGQLVRWLVKVGDQVKEGDTLAEIQTDKAVMPMESFEDGVVAVLDVKEGDDIALGQRVLLLASKGEDYKLLGGQKAKTGPAPSAAKEAKDEGGSAAKADKGEGGPAAKGDETANGQSPDVTPSTDGGRVKSTPLARKIAAEASIDIAQVAGSGPAGRVVRNDVESYLSNRGSGAATAVATAPASRPAAAQATAPPRPAAPVGKPQRIPHSPMRKTIAKRMMESKQSAPEIHVTVDVRIDKLLAVREALNARLASEKVKLSVGDFVTKAVAQALRVHPGVNASYEPDALVLHPEVNIGIAVALEAGLMVPVLRNADQLGLRDIRLGTDALVKATRGNSLKPNQLMGGTFSISNLGMYGVKQFDAIINQPEVAILAVGAGEKRPVVEGDALVVGTVMSLTLTADHRAVDGALAAEFLRTVRLFLEEPASMLL